MRLVGRLGVAAIAWVAGVYPLVLPSTAGGQSVPRAFGVVAVGASDAHLGWTGTASVLAIRYQHLLQPALAVEIGEATLFNSKNDTAILMPEIGVHAMTGRAVAAFTGLGGGIAIPLLGEGQTALTGHAAFGLRLATTARMMLQVEARIRIHGTSGQRTADLTVGLVRRLPAR